MQGFICVFTGTPTKVGATHSPFPSPTVPWWGKWGREWGEAGLQTDVEEPAVKDFLEIADE